MAKITSIIAREILDSRGNPTVGVNITLDNNISAFSSVPSGASTGSREALELRDNDFKRYKGKGVLKAVENINTIISKALVSKDVSSQNEIYEIMKKIKLTEKKENIEAKDILCVSLAVLIASSKSEKINLYQRISNITESKKSLPCQFLC